MRAQTAWNSVASLHIGSAGQTFYGEADRFMQESSTRLPDAAAHDALLMRLCQEQPQTGIAALYDRYGRVVFSVALRIVGDRGTAEEITQDVFLSCWRHAATYRSERGSVLTWLLSMTHHRAIDELRSRRHRTAQREIELDDSTVSGGTFETDIDLHLVQMAVRAALADLPPAQREVIELIFFGGLSRQEAAQHLQSPLGTIHTRLRLGMAKLRQALATLIDDELNHTTNSV